MSARLENTPDDIDVLVGATIVKAWITPREEYSPPAGNSSKTAPTITRCSTTDPSGLPRHEQKR